MASLHQNASGTWLLRFRFDGRQYYRSLNTDSETAAQNIKGQVDETIALLKQGRLSLPEGADSEAIGHFILSGGRVDQRPTAAPKPKPLKEVVDAYFDSLPDGSKAKSSLDTEKTHANHLQRILKGSIPLRQIGVEELQGYVRKRSRESGHKGKKIQPVTLKKELMTFSQIRSFARQRQWVEGGLDMRDVRLPKPAEKPPFRTWREIETIVGRGGLNEQQIAELWDSLFLGEKEILDLLKHVEEKAEYPFIYPMFAFAAFTGARRSEILRSETADFDFGNNQVFIREKKRKHKTGGSFRHVELNERLKKIMRNWFDRHPGGHLAICIEPGQPLSRNAAHHHFTKTLKDSKWAKIRGFHVLRHSFASICASRGVPESVVDAWLGHMTEAMRGRYRHLFPEQTQTAMANLFGETLPG
jgi:integrase